MRTFVVTLLLVAFFNSIFADIYMHNPRGSNNRNCERNGNRNNDNRLFDSQNNGAGGYACPRAVGGPETVTPTMYYYVGSQLRVEWTNQHSCGSNPNAHCEITLQYSCVEQMPGLRDGTPTDMNDAATDSLTQVNKDDARQGSHETFDYYTKCATRRRNMGLYTADQQNLGPGSKATQTRQNNNGNKYGWECQEERDYYPYFHPSPWKDIVIMTNNVSRCDFYQANSQNVVGKGECYDAQNNYLQWENENDCIVNNGVWQISQPWGIPPPECIQNQYSRDNHLGNGIDGEMNSYWWTIPNTPSNACVLRLRYNISTGDFPWEYNYIDNTVGPQTDPVINLGYPASVEFKINTDQYGRTFQDRSYVFAIKARPNNIPSNANIWNLNVRGKRGNIVEVYPAIEYDYAPRILSVNGGDYIHFQWTGSDYNPNRNPNDGQGGPPDKADPNSFRADRSNILQTSGDSLNIPRPASAVTMFLTPNGTPDYTVINALSMLNQPGLTSSDPTVMCLNLTQLLAKNGNNRDNARRDIQNCGMLGNAPTPYFDAGLVQMRASGRFTYLSSRNNNFSNRSQKGILIVNGGEFNSAVALVANFAMIVLCVFFAL